MNEMRDVELVMRFLENEFGRVQRLATERKELGLLGLSPALTDEKQQQLNEWERQSRDGCRTVLEDMLKFPPRHIRHQSLLRQFWDDGSYERSVFIMTKYPGRRPTAPKDQELIRVINAVRTAIDDAGFIPRIAGEKEYHDQLWDNVELYMLGCERGVAIVEDRYLQELNPNVTMEWGWMRAMRKKTLYLVEETFSRGRADLSGLNMDPFAWEAPDADISEAVHKFLSSS